MVMWSSIAAGDGAAAGMFTGLDGLRICRDLVQRLALETIKHPPSLAAIRDQARLLQHLEVKRQTGLGDPEHVLQLTDAALLMRKHFDDLDSCFVREGMEPAGDVRGFGAGGSGHLSTYQVLLIRQGSPWWRQQDNAQVPLCFSGLTIRANAIMCLSVSPSRPKYFRRPTRCTPTRPAAFSTFRWNDTLDCGAPRISCNSVTQRSR